MRKILPGLLLSGALLLGACGGPATTTLPTSSTGGTSATSATGSDMSATSSTGGTSATSATGSDMSATSSTGGTSATSSTGGTSATSAASSGMSATSSADNTVNEAATAISEAAGALSAVANDVTIQQGEALILDASQSAGNINDYKWTIEKAPTGAESVIGQVIREGSSGNVSLQPQDYAKYFPTAGTYTVRLTVTDTAGQTSNTDFNVDMP